MNYLSTVTNAVLETGWRYRRASAADAIFWIKTYRNRPEMASDLRNQVNRYRSLLRDIHASEMEMDRRGMRFVR